MANQVLTEIYRCRENGKTFSSVCTITYFNKEAIVQGMHGEFNRSDWDELHSYLQSKGIKTVRYCRLKNGQLIEKSINLSGK
jgi:hypothetical protein